MRPTDTLTGSAIVDMHLHTTESDGVRTPTEVVNAAIKLGLAGIAITDHDTVSGVAEAVTAAEQSNTDVLSGIEFTAEKARKELHILGYGVNTRHAGLLSLADKLRQSRLDRARSMVNKLSGLGIELDFDDVLEQAGPGNIGRPHIARAMLDAGIISTMQEAFERFIGRNCPAYADRWRVEPVTAVNLIHDAGGLAFLAHPGLRGASSYIRFLVDRGLDGIEVYHSRHTPETVAKLDVLADKLGILKSGGSDCHGPSREGPALIGSQPVPIAWFERIKAALADGSGQRTRQGTIS